MSYEEVVKSACSRNEKVRRYIGDKYKIEYNIKLRPIVELLQNHNYIVQTSQKPIVFQWINTERDTGNNTLHLTDATDVSDISITGPGENNNKDAQENKIGLYASISDVSVTSDKKENQMAAISRYFLQ